MDLSSVTPQQKMLAAAGANVLFIISLFFPWFGADVPEGLGIDASANGWDTLPVPWLLLAFAAAAAVLLAAEAFDYELPLRVPPFAAAAYLSSIPFWFTLATLIDLDGRKWGLFLGFLFTLAATVISVLVWREEEA